MAERQENVIRCEFNEICRCMQAINGGKCVVGEQEWLEGLENGGVSRVVFIKKKSNAAQALSRPAVRLGENW